MESARRKAQDPLVEQGETHAAQEGRGSWVQRHYAFNLAMLAKQSWRLLKDPDSLCAQVLKAKYFANTSVMEAKPKANMSYSWRSILRGLQVIKQGMIWRVSNGCNLNIWKDPWLPQGISRIPITPRGACLLTQVAELINLAMGSWDVDLVKETF